MGKTYKGAFPEQAIIGRTLFSCNSREHSFLRMIPAKTCLLRENAGVLCGTGVYEVCYVAVSSSRETSDGGDRKQNRFYRRACCCTTRDCLLPTFSRLFKHESMCRGADCS